MERLPATKPLRRNDTWVAPCGGDGVDTTAEVASQRNLSSFASKRLPVSGCIVLNYSANR